ncbi:MAG: repressor LexA [Candidatus Aminicenantes bacterium]|nr:MAG: repressor LexA [Candidatus Aminicenantes bacterium]
MLTKKQKDFLDSLKEVVRKHGYFPTVREVGKMLGLSSPATVHSYLNRLYEKGYLTKKNNKDWELAVPSSSVPLVGIVPAGDPLEVFESLGEEIELPQWMVDTGGDVSAFRVQGESMRDAYIQDGDVVVVKRTPSAEIGEMVVALLEDASITLKRLKSDGKKVWLMPENPEYQPIHDPFKLVGRVVGVLRKYR